MGELRDKAVKWINERKVGETFTLSQFMEGTEIVSGYASVLLHSFWDARYLSKVGLGIYKVEKVIVE